MSSGHRLDQIEVAGLALGRGERDLALVDAVGVDDDPGAERLAEDLGQAHGRHRGGADQVGEHRAGADRGQLVDVPDDQESGSVRDRAQELVHQHRVHHRRLVDDQELGLQRVLGIALEAEGLGVELKQAMHRLGLDAGGLGQALGGAAGGRGQQDLDPLGCQDAQQAVDQGGLADPGTAGDDGHLVGEHGRDRVALGGREREPGLRLDPGEGLLRIDVAPRRRALEQAADVCDAQPSSARCSGVR
jgi:hypothetical protein